MHNPGSVAAEQMGCLCPVMDNHNGEGFMYGGTQVFWINGSCPLHGDRAVVEEEYVSEV